MGRPRTGEALVNGLALKRARAALGFSAAELAKLVGVDRHSISKIESGVTAVPDSLTLCRIARTLGVSMDSLINAAAATPADSWKSQVWSQIGDGHADAIREAFDEGRLTIAATRTAESVMIPPEMLVWAETRRLTGQVEKPLIGDWLAFYKRHSKKSTEAKHRSDSKSVTILRKDFLHDASREEGGWVRDMSRRIQEYGERVEIRLASEAAWLALERRVKKVIGGARWNKLLAVDDSFAVWWSTPEHYRFTRHADSVRGLRAALEETARPLHESWFSTREELERIALGKKR